MSEEPRTRTGRARASLAEAIQEDFVEVRSHLEAAISLAEHLAAESGGVSGATAYWRGVGQKLGHELDQMQQRLAETTRALTERRAVAGIAAATDDDHMDRVREAREGDAA